tara:strand:+ start:1573 stop:2412 length:840 start_codon:yes stop_codon:yes gene_type:complete
MKAILLNLSAWIMLPIMDGLAKYLSTSLPVLQIVWARYFFTVTLVLPIILIFFRKNLKLSINYKLQFLRGILLFTANILFFYSISIISLSKALTLAFTAPLIVTVFSPLFLQEKVSLNRWLAVIIGFFGCIIVIRPGFIDLNLATIAALGTGLMYGFYLIVTRKLSGSDDSLITLLFTGVVGAIIASFSMPFMWVSPSFNGWVIMFLIGLFASIGHLLLILSLKLADASKLAPFGYFEIIPNILIGFYFFNYFPDLFHLLGLLIIISSGIYVFKNELNN